MSLQGPGSQNEPGGLADLVAQLKRMGSRLDELERGAILRTAGISVAPTGMTIDSNLSLTGTLSLPAGIINNDALANPIEFGSDWDDSAAFALPNAWTEYAWCSITVPAGYTKIHFDVIASLLAGNTLTSTQYLIDHIERQINGTGPVYSSVFDRTTLPAGFFGSAMAPYKWSETVTPGDVHRFSLKGWAGGGAWAASADNYARIEASALFTR